MTIAPDCPAATLAHVLAGHLEIAPDAPLLVAPEPGVEISYRRFSGAVAALSTLFHEHGLARGDTVAFLLHNGLATAELFLGTMVAGFVVAPLNLLAQRSHLAYSLEHSDCRLIVTTEQELPRVEAALSETSAARRAAIARLAIDVDRSFVPAAADGTAFDPSPARAGDPCLLMYTSGTTGMPKGALLTHANLLHAARAVNAWHGLGRSDRVLSSLPLYHINGQVIATVTPFVSGGSVVMPHRFSASAWWPMVERHRPTWLNMVPTIIAYLLNGAEPGRSHAYPSVRFGRSASAPLPPAQHRAFEETFGIPVIEAMGMTESASVVFCNPMERERRKYGSPGLPCGVEAKVVDPSDSAHAPLPDGVTGELMLRGPNVMRGYHKAPEITAKALDADGWLATGDLGHRDADGFYFVTGRLKELIIKGGENIAPREIDEVLLAHPAVLEAAAFGIPDAAYGQEIAAAIVLKPGVACEIDALVRHCLDRLGRYKSPKHLRLVDELPKGPSGKIQRLKLGELLAGTLPPAAGGSRRPAPAN